MTTEAGVTVCFGTRNITSSASWKIQREKLANTVVGALHGALEVTMAHNNNNNN
jgi:hypothetical protein